jgi:transcriptional regulator with XRE-family HTH domain
MACQDTWARIAKSSTLICSSCKYSARFMKMTNYNYTAFDGDSTDCRNGLQQHFLQSVPVPKTPASINRLGMQRKYPENNIRKIRSERGLTLEKLAGMLEPQASHDMIAKIETGERELTHTWMDRLARALHCAPEDFIRFSQNKISFSGVIVSGLQMRLDTFKEDDRLTIPSELSFLVIQAHMWHRMIAMPHSCIRAMLF